MVDRHSGELEPEAAAQLEQHLAGCPSCQAEDAELREIISLTEEAVSEFPDSALNSAESSAMLEQMREEWIKPALVKPRKISVWRRVIEYGAVAMLLIVLAGMLLPALNSAREKARRISCSSNLDQIDPSLKAYCRDASDDERNIIPKQLGLNKKYRGNARGLDSSSFTEGETAKSEEAEVVSSLGVADKVYSQPASRPTPAMKPRAMPMPALAVDRKDYDRSEVKPNAWGDTSAAMAPPPPSRVRRSKSELALGRKEDNLQISTWNYEAKRKQAARKEMVSSKSGATYGNVLFQGSLAQSRLSPETAKEVKKIMADEFKGQVKFRRLPKNIKNLFLLPTLRKPVSTFSLDTDTASYTMARRKILAGYKPNPKNVRAEEFVNYFDYHYLKPKGEERFAVYLDAAPSPFRPENTLLRIAVQGRDLGPDTAKANAWTLLVDASGSMAQDDRMRLTRKALELLLKRFKPQDRVSLVLAANENIRVINNVPYKMYAQKLQRIIAGIEPDGVCDFRAAVKLAYDTAVKNYLPGSGNRVVIFTDGIVKEGTGKADPILRDIAEARKHGITNTVIGVGGDGNDELLETIANKGDGSYVFIDSTAEAEKVFKRDFAARFRELARDFKIQVVFNPSVILAYRQIGYRNRQLTAKQFRDDKVDAGEVGSGQSATALYEMKISKKALDEEVGAKVYIRYKTAHNLAAEERVFTITAGELRAENKLSPGFLLAACAAEFAEYLAFPGEPNKATPSRIREVIAPSANLYDPKITTFLRLLRTCK